MTTIKSVLLATLLIPFALQAADEPELGSITFPNSGAAEAQELDRVIHQPVRLAMVSALAVNDELSFGDLKGLLGVSDGNLSVHARKLEDAGYVICEKGFVGRSPMIPKLLGVRTIPAPMCHAQTRFTTTRAVIGCDTISVASCSRPPTHAT